MRSKRDGRGRLRPQKGADKAAKGKEGAQAYKGDTAGSGHKKGVRAKAAKRGLRPLRGGGGSKATKLTLFN